MYKNLAVRHAAACLFAIALFTSFSPVQAQSQRAADGADVGKDPLKIGFVYVAPLTEAGWVRQHEEGRLAVDAALGARVKTAFVEDVAEGPDAERVIRDLARQGNKLIFTPSFGYMEPTLKVAQEFPDVKFESITGYKTAANVAVANARYYEGRYLAGVAAGRVTRSNVAGYVAGFPIPEVLQGINAFTLGMRSVNPQAQVKVLWLNVWFDPAKERDAAMALMNQGFSHRVDGSNGRRAGARALGGGVPLGHAQSRPHGAVVGGEPPLGPLLHRACPCGLRRALDVGACVGWHP
jgi:basic membrane protein A and related proteins